MNIKKILKWGGLLTLIWIILFLSNEFFIRDWRRNSSEASVQKSIVENYKNKEDKFRHLIQYVQNLKINTTVEIEFLKNNKIDSWLDSPFVSYSIKINATPFDLTPYDDENKGAKPPEFEFMPNGNAEIDYVDTTIESNSWSWNFEGGKDNFQFEKFINYLGISELELETLGELIDGTCFVDTLFMRNKN